MTLLSLKNTALAVAVICLLPACTPMSPQYNFNEGDPILPLSKKEKILQQAHFDKLEAQRDDIRKGELSSAEKQYTKNPKNPDVTLTYAKLLRKVGFVEQAKMILHPFAVDSKLSTEDILIEYAKANLELGDFDTAQIFAQEASFISDSAKSSMVLGVALGSQGHHEAAELNFRNALDNVGLDIQLRAKVLNNLALNLLLQQRAGEAQEIMNMVDRGVLDSNTLMKFESNEALLQGV